MKALGAVMLALMVTPAFAQSSSISIDLPKSKSMAAHEAAKSETKTRTANKNELATQAASSSSATSLQPVTVAPAMMTAADKVAFSMLGRAAPSKDGYRRLVVLRGLDKITGRPSNVYAPIGVPVQYATLSITARYCYSTPVSEPPETTAFLQIVDHRPDETSKPVFSGWMLASSPSLNGLQHPLYDVWVISCVTNKPGQQAPVVASTAAVKATSPDANASEAMPDLPEGSGQ